MKIKLLVGFLLAFMLVACSKTADTAVPEEQTATQETVQDEGTTGSIDLEGASKDADTALQDVKTDVDNIVRDIFNSVYFKFDRFSVEGSNNLETIRLNAELLSAANASVRVEGNTDEWGSDEYNYALALKRASSVKNSLIERGIDASKISTVSYGESKPKCSARTKECWQENRRVDFIPLP